MNHTRPTNIRLIWFLLFALIMSLPSATLWGQAPDSKFSIHDKYIENLIQKLGKSWPDESRKKISAVLPFYRQSIENLNAYGTYLSETCSDLLVSSLHLKVVNRTMLNNFIEEIEFQQDELVMESTRKELGQFLGADYILIGSFWFFGDSVKVSLRVYDVESAYALTAASIYIPKDSVPDDFLHELSKESETDQQISESKRTQRLQREAPKAPEPEKTTARLTIVPNPMDSLVLVEGVIISPLELENMELPEGEYLISASCDNHVSVEERVHLKKGESRVLILNLKKEDQAAGTNSSPWSKTIPSETSTKEDTLPLPRPKPTKTPPIKKSGLRRIHFTVMAIRNRYTHIKDMEMTVDSQPVHLSLVSDIARSQMTYERTYKGSAILNNGHHRCVFGGRLKTGGLFSTSFGRERWVTINPNTTDHYLIKLGNVAPH